MKWNDAWLSNKDCDEDGLLDRHDGYPAYIGSGAWETNHQWGENEDGSHWNYFVKIVAVPEDTVCSNSPCVDGSIWYDGESGEEIGVAIWGSFAIIQEVYNDPLADAHGAQYISPYSAGFGRYGPQN